MLLTLAAALFVLSIVIFVHEIGHFLAAKVVGIYVKTFSIGFGPKVLRRRWGETEYALSALPLGGYVKFAGEWMSGEEEASGPPPERVEPEELPAAGGDRELARHLERLRVYGLSPRQAEERREGVPLERLSRHTRGELDQLWRDDRRIHPSRHFRSHPVRHRVLVVSAGPLMNLLLAFGIYAGIFWIQGTPRVPATTTIEDVLPGSPAEAAGLEPGDRVVSLDGREIGTWRELIEVSQATGGAPTEVGVQREGEPLRLRITPQFDDSTERWFLGIRPRVPPRVGRVKKDGPAWEAGLREGALILAVGDSAVASYLDLQRRILPHPGEPLVIRWRDPGGEVREATMVPAEEKDLVPGSRTETRTVGRIGIGPHVEMEKMGFLSSVVEGGRATYNLAREIVLFLGVLVRGKASIDSVGGPLRVGQMAGEMVRWGVGSLLYFLAFFSLNLCIFNLLPILPFDGGHLAFFAYEGIVRRPVHRRIQEIIMQVGFVLLVLLMIIVISLDAIHVF
jgi:regulator of sigma E protease